jgi:hypothetical protein
MPARAGLEVLENIKFSSFYGETNYDSSVVPFVAQTDRTQVGSETTGPSNQTFSITLHLGAKQPRREADQQTSFDSWSYASISLHVFKELCLNIGINLFFPKKFFSDAL